MNALHVNKNYANSIESCLTSIQDFLIIQTFDISKGFVSDEARHNAAYLAVLIYADHAEIPHPAISTYGVRDLPVFFMASLASILCKNAITVIGYTGSNTLTVLPHTSDRDKQMLDRHRAYAPLFPTTLDLQYLYARIQVSVEENKTLITNQTHPITFITRQGGYDFQHVQF